MTENRSPQIIHHMTLTESFDFPEHQFCLLLKKKKKNEGVRGGKRESLGARNKSSLQVVRIKCDKLSESNL